MAVKPALGYIKCAKGLMKFFNRRTIGQLKRRFHCLHAELRMLPELCCTIAVACCVMHNIAQHYTCREGDCDLPPEVPVPPSPPEADDGVARRHAIVHQHFRGEI